MRWWLADTGLSWSSVTHDL